MAVTCCVITWEIPMYGLSDTEIQMTHRQILAEEEMVARQRGIVERISRSGELGEIGRAYLAELEDSLAKHRDQLARLTAPSHFSAEAHQ